MKNVRPGYKTSEKGIIPSEWQIKSFTECISIKNGQVDPKIKPYCDMVHIGPGNIEKFTGKLLYFNTAKEDMQTSGKYLFDEGDILYGKINPQLGKVVYPKFEGICSADMYPLKARETELIPLYLKYLILSEDFFKYSVSVSMRTGMPKINRNELSEYKLLLPDLEEQEKISLILFSIDEKIENTDNLIEKTKELKKGLMQKLLTEGIGHDRFKDTEIGRIPEGWKIKKLSDIGEIVTGSTPRTSEKENYGFDYLWVSPADMGTEKYIIKTKKMLSKLGFEKTRKLSAGSILVTCIGSTIGKIAISGYELSTNQQINSIVCNPKYDNEFIYYVIDFNFKNYISYIATQAVPIINKSTFSGFQIQIPSLEEQKQIASILSSIDEKIQQYESKKEKLQELKKGLMQKLLTGKIRVKI